jgi:hypothetical protein
MAVDRAFHAMMAMVELDVAELQRATADRGTR